MTFQIKLYHGIDSGIVKLYIEKTGYLIEILMNSSEILELINSIDAWKKVISDFNDY